jgi:excisionase family DNA binding protein
MSSLASDLHAARKAPRPAFALTVGQAARELGVGPGTVRRWADTGMLACYRTPGFQRRFSRQQLDDFLASARGR